MEIGGQVGTAEALRPPGIRREPLFAREPHAAREAQFGHPCNKHSIIHLSPPISMKFFIFPNVNDVMKRGHRANPTPEKRGNTSRPDRIPIEAVHPPLPGGRDEND